MTDHKTVLLTGPLGRVVAFSACTLDGPGLNPGGFGIRSVLWLSVITQASSQNNISSYCSKEYCEQSENGGIVKNYKNSRNVVIRTKHCDKITPRSSNVHKKKKKWDIVCQAQGFNIHKKNNIALSIRKRVN